MAKSVLICGATGQQGGALVKQLLKRGDAFKPIAFTRNTDSPSAKKLSSQGVELVKGSFSDRQTLVKALQKVDAAFLVTYPMGKGGVEQEARDGINFVDAAVEAKLGHLVFSSVGDADNHTGVPHFDSKRKIEQHLEKSGLTYTILRPVAFYDNFPKRSGVATFAAFGLFEAALYGKELQYVAVKDIACYAAEALGSPEKYKGRALPLVGDSLTISQVQDAYGRVQGFRPWKAPLPGLVIRLLPFDFRQMMLFFFERGYSYDLKQVRQEVGPMTTFEEWLRSDQ